jgi:Ig-like domain-containing protein
MRKYFTKLLVPTLALIVILACSQFGPSTPQPAATLNALYTSAAQTLESMSTQGAYTLTAQPFTTETLGVASLTPTGFQTFTAVPPLQTFPTRCDSAAFVQDITYPDGSTVAVGSSFTKIWRIQNTGTCTWNSSYALVFVSGERFGAPSAVGLPGNVGPGQTVDISVNLTSPNTNGSYIGYWKLRNASGVLFGVGAGDANIFVDIKVAGYTVGAYDFLAHYCDANWSNDARDLPCPGTEGDNRGFVILKNAPKMENGRSIGEGLLTYPERGSQGMISGKYPGFRIQTGDRFQANVGCMYRANDCDVIFRVQYQIGNGNINTLGQWREIYEGQSYPVNIDLSFLDGERVKFILTVFANGTSQDDFALWITPRITRQSSRPPTITMTSSLTLTPTVSATPTITATITATSTPTATPTATDTPTLTPTP